MTPDDVWEWFCNKLLTWALSSLLTLLTWWLTSDAYEVPLTGDKGGVLYDLRAHINWLTAVMVFAGFLFAACKTAMQRNGQPFREIFSQFLSLVVISCSVVAIANLAFILMDRYSNWVITDLAPKQKDWSKYWNTRSYDSLKGHEAGTSFLVAAFALAALVSSVIQFILMMFRAGVLLIIVGVLPPVAASRFTSHGNAAYKSLVRLGISLWLFEGAAATIYAAALDLMASPYEADRLGGLALVGGAVFALPATLRAVVPEVEEDNASFGIRQVGHFAASGTSVTLSQGAGIWTRWTGIGTGPNGGGGSAFARSSWWRLGPSADSFSIFEWVSWRIRDPNNFRRGSGAGPQGATGPGPTGTGTGTGIQPTTGPGPSNSGIQPTTGPGPSNSGIQPTTGPGPSNSGIQPTTGPGPSGSGIQPIAGRSAAGDTHDPFDSAEDFVPIIEPYRVPDPDFRILEEGAHIVWDSIEWDNGPSGSDGNGSPSGSDGLSGSGGPTGSR
ncbi:hypothetical protein [Actinomadura physcomitrii]|uniref:hypothetical protein n=1 Tax=Actinomadura physcomitrii TaxID=2650748 RepID=UPI001923F9C6|nr:hypothetical protein [Actinomadura physcomitrii]